MTKSKVSDRTPRAASRPPRNRRPPSSGGWTARSLALVAVATVITVGVVVFVSARAGEDSPGASTAGLTGGDFHSLVVDPANPERLFVGGHTAVSESTDGGATWHEVASLRDADAMGWAFVGDTVYVSGHPGLIRSNDNGRTFERINDGLPDTDVHAFGATADILYGSTPSTGVFASGDGPGGWIERNPSVGQAFFGRLVVDPGDPNHVVAADAKAGVVASTDGGATWQLLDSGLPGAAWVSASGDGLEVLVASGPVGAARSIDGGQTWAPLTLPEGATLVEAVASNADQMYAGIHRDTGVEVLVSHDAGGTWTPPSPAP